MSRWRLVAALMLAALAASACTDDGIGIEFGTPNTSSAVTPGNDEGSKGLAIEVEPIDTGETRALGAMRALCVAPELVSTDDDGAPAGTPADVQQVELQVEQVRALEFLHPVAVQPVSAGEIAAKLEGAFDETYPKEFYDRRSVAWQTIGVMPRNVSIRDALLAYQTGQVIGFYNPVDGELVYRADGDLDLAERVTLAHELTHAIDDQHFDLSRIDRLAGTCREEEFQAALGAVEGSAQFFSIKVLFEFPPDDGEFGGLGGGGMPEGVPPFMADLQLWPYTAGQGFVTDLETRGGITEVDGALRRFPTTTEQVLHPERYPADRPSPVDVPDVAADLGPAWGDLDVMQIGEAWLASMLELRLDPSAAEAAAAGWDGGIYRSFTDGTDAAVVLATAWDTTADAEAFEQAVREWFGANDERVVLGRPSPERVTFAVSTSDDARVDGVLGDAVT